MTSAVVEVLQVSTSSSQCDLCLVHSLNTKCGRKCQRWRLLAAVVLCVATVRELQAVFVAPALRHLRSPPSGARQLGYCEQGLAGPSEAPRGRARWGDLPSTVLLAPGVGSEGGGCRHADNHTSAAVHESHWHRTPRFDRMMAPSAIPKQGHFHSGCRGDLCRWEILVERSDGLSMHLATAARGSSPLVSADQRPRRRCMGIPSRRWTSAPAS